MVSQSMLEKEPSAQIGLKKGPFLPHDEFIVNILEGASKGQNGDNFEVSESFEKRKRK